MKKSLLYLFLPIIAVFIAVFVIFFTPFGSNSVIKPLANSFISKKIKKPKIEITKLDSKIGFINIDAKSDNGIFANIKGDVRYLDEKFDLTYKVKADSVKVEDKDIKVDLNLKGQAVGSVKDFGVNGMGEAFDSDIKYRFIINNNNPESINISVNSAQIAKIFALLNQVPIIDGYLFVNANMPSLNIKNPKGSAKIEIKEGRFNRGYINREYKILLPKDEKFKANIDMAVMRKYIIGKGNINTTTAKLKIKKLTSTLNFKQSKTYYSLKIDNLSRVENIANMKLRGKLLLDGVTYINLDKNIYQLSAKTSSLGGELKTIYNTNSVKMALKNISIVKILKMFSQPFYLTSGNINGIVNITNIKHLTGAFDISSKGVLNKKLLKFKLPSYGYYLRAKGVLKDSILSLKNISLKTGFLALYLQNFKYSILTRQAKGDYVLNLNNLKALKGITKSSFRGKLKATGAFTYSDGNVNFNLSTKSLGGILKAHYRGNSLKSKFRDISLDKLLYVLNQPHYLNKGVASGDIDIYDIKKLDGKFTLKSLGSVDTKLIKRLYKIDLGRVFKYSMLIKNGVLKDGRFLTKPKVNTSFGTLNFDYLNFDTKSTTLTAKYILNINNLQKLKPLIKQQLNGSFKVKGDIKYSANQLLINGVANELGGVINFLLENDNIKLTGAGISIVRTFQMLNYDPVLDGVSKLDLNYNTKIKKGKFNLTLNEARFLNSQLVSTLKQYANFDLSKEIFSSASLNGNINGDIITFNLNTSSQRVQISTQNAQINTKNQTINARIKVVHKNQDYHFRVKGPISNPHIKIIFSGYIKNKVKKKVLEKLKDTGLGKEIKKIIPKEIKSLKEDNQTREQIEKVIPKELKGIFNML